ncbi:hypothetical protein WN51_03119 [Melipona quadrifasciata]|uniref:CCHC-type domain-containing protein n=1 Tax=Melipona quadrifasciata TaxID=166423 RepID=A0A0M8ZWH3_9HYME|nr:hypothetical protein WN51_03119 [Melipona quadrifasciata]
MQTKREWRRRVSEADKRKTFSDLIAFLEQQYKFLTIDSQSREIPPPTLRRFVAQRERKPAVVLNANEVKYPLCSDNHLLSRRERFKKLTIERRRKTAKELRVCFNCLRPGHGVKRCMSSACQVCQVKHHNLLYQRTTSGLDTSRTPEDTEAGRSDGSNPPQTYTVASAIPLEHVLLSAAMITDC